jgi:shikimate dehydrogenase
MYPNINECPPLPYEALTSKHYLFDLVYNPAKTLFLQKGAEQGAAIKNGHDMLIIQAEESWRIWNA